MIPHDDDSTAAGSVTGWILDLKSGDPRAAQRLWDRYVKQLIRLAHYKLGSAPRRMADEEDVVATAFAQFFAGVEQRRFSRLDDRNDLWQILVRLTDCRAKDQLRRVHTRRKHETGESALQGSGAETCDQHELQGIRCPVATPQFTAEMLERFHALLESLEDDTLRQIAVWKMESRTSQEIADLLGRSVRTVERKLRMIRDRWRDLSEV